MENNQQQEQQEKPKNQQPSEMPEQSGKKPEVANIPQNSKVIPAEAKKNSTL